MEPSSSTWRAGCASQSAECEYQNAKCTEAKPVTQTRDARDRSNREDIFAKTKILHPGSTESAVISSLLAEMDGVIAGIATLNRRSAYAALETAFSGLKVQSETLSGAETSEFIELVHLVLLQFARGETIRVSGPRQARELDVCLKYNDAYEAALYHAMEFLARNLFDHLEKYSPNQYLRAALRVLGKEYYRALTDSYQTDSILDESAVLQEDEPCREDGGWKREEGGGKEEALTVVGPEAGNPAARPPEDVPGQDVEQQMFHNWYEGNLSRSELARLYGLTMDRVNQILLRVAQTFESGRLHGMVKWLTEMGEDGDIIWLLSKGMTAADVGQKVHRNQWVVYKHRDAVLKRFEPLRLAGDAGRAFCARLFGLETGAVHEEHLSQAARDWAVKVGLMERETEAPALSG
jgi:hypothetical protein